MKIVTELLYRTMLLIRIKKHRSSTIYSFDVLLQLMHADIADIRFFFLDQQTMQNIAF